MKRLESSYSETFQPQYEFLALTSKPPLQEAPKGHGLQRDETESLIFDETARLYLSRGQGMQDAKNPLDAVYGVDRGEYMHAGTHWVLY